MNKIIPMGELAERLAQCTGADLQTAEIFLRNFTAITARALGAGEKVTIEQLGTFARASFGEHAVLFEPAASLAEDVNAPFAMFEPVELADGITETDLDTADVLPVAESVTADETPAPTDALAATDENEPATICEPATETTAETTASDATAEPDITPTTETEATGDAAEESYDTPAAPRHTSVVALAAAFILGVLLGAVAVWAYYADRETRRMLEYADTPVATDSIAQPRSDVATSSAVATAQPDTAEAQAARTQPAPAPEPTPTPEPVYDTVTTTRYLTTMARQHYGAMEYWVYIYDANSDILDNPNRIKPGTKVLIPPFEKYAAGGIDSDENRAAAKRRADEIYSRYK